jgi:hypothetical protein
VTDGVGEDGGPTDDVEGDIGVGAGAFEPLQATRRSDTSSPTAAALMDNGA